MQPQSESIHRSASKEDVSSEAPYELGGDEGDVEPLGAVYRHNVHKLRMRDREGSAEIISELQVQEGVPLGAERHAAVLSRPARAREGTQLQTEAIHHVMCSGRGVVSTGNRAAGETTYGKH